MRWLCLFCTSPTADPEYLVLRRPTEYLAEMQQTPMYCLIWSQIFLNYDLPTTSRRARQGFFDVIFLLFNVWYFSILLFIDVAPTGYIILIQRQHVIILIQSQHVIILIQSQHVIILTPLLDLVETYPIPIC